MPNSQESSQTPSPSTPEPRDIAPVCEAHGIPMERGLGMNPKWICEDCARAELANQHAMDLGARALQERREAQERKQAELERRMGQSGIPARYRDFSFDTFPARTDEARNVVQALRSYSNRFLHARKNGISVLLTGPSGTGKTGLACSVANAIMRDHGATALFMSAYGSVRHQRDTWGRRGKSEREALDDLLMPDLLILDEVGTSVGGDSEMASFYEVLNGRYSERKPTFLLANLPIDDYESGGLKRPGLRSYLGPRIMSRFSDDGSSTFVMKWQSLRGLQHGE